MADMLRTDLGWRIELVPMDQHYGEISVALHRATAAAGAPAYDIHSYSSKPGAADRLAAILQMMVELAGMERCPEAPLRVRFACGDAHERAARRAFIEACKANPAQPGTQRPFAVFDRKTEATIGVQPLGNGVYRAQGAAGAAAPVAARLGATRAGAAQAGAAQSGAAQSGTPQSGTAQTGAGQSGTPPSGTAQTGAAHTAGSAGASQMVDPRLLLRVATMAGGLAKLASMVPVPGTVDQVRFACGTDHHHLVSLLLRLALNARGVLREQELAAARGILAAPSQQR